MKSQKSSASARCSSALTRLDARRGALADVAEQAGAADLAGPLEHARPSRCGPGTPAAACPPCRRMAQAWLYGPKYLVPFALGAAHHHDPRVLLAHGDGQVGVALVVPVPDVEPRVELLDPGVLELERLDLGADHGPVDARRGGQHRLGARVQAGEVGEVGVQPLAEGLRLADVDDPAALVAEPVDARATRGSRPAPAGRPCGSATKQLYAAAGLTNPPPAGHDGLRGYLLRRDRAAGRPLPLGDRRWPGWPARPRPWCGLPSLSSVTQSDNTSFLPASAPSEQAAQLASPLQGASLTAVTVVAARPGGPLTGADQASVARLAGALARVARVTSVRDAGAVRRRPGRAAHRAGRAGPVRRPGHHAAGQPGSRACADAIAGRGAAGRAGGAHRGPGGDPGGQQRDLHARPAARSSGSRSSSWSRCSSAVFRSALAPLIAVLPAAGRGAGRRAAHRRGRRARPGRVADRLAAADRAGARRGHGLRAVPDVPGAGGDARRAGLPRRRSCFGGAGRRDDHVLRRASSSPRCCRWPPPPSASTPGWRPRWPSRIGLMLIAGLTLLPALLAICGPVAFWPSSVGRAPGGPGGGGRRAPGSCGGRSRPWSPAWSSSARSRWPRPATWRPGSAARRPRPAGSDSALGNALLAEHFPQTAANPTVIVLRLRQPAWADPRPGGRGRAAAGRRPGVHRGVRAAGRQRHGADRGAVRRAVRRLRAGPRAGRRRPPRASRGRSWPPTRPTGRADRT